MQTTFKIRDRSGAPWYSACGAEVYNNQLRSCLENSRLSEPGKALIGALLGEGVEGVQVVDDSGALKVVCRVEKVRMTIPIDNPGRAAVGTSFNALAQRLSVRDKRGAPKALPVARAAPCGVASPRVDLEARIRARASLGPGASAAQVERAAQKLELAAARGY